MVQMFILSFAPLFAGQWAEEAVDVAVRADLAQIMKISNKFTQPLTR